jgi:hypothetical protein
MGHIPEQLQRLHLAVGAGFRRGEELQGTAGTPWSFGQPDLPGAALTKHTHEPISRHSLDSRVEPDRVAAHGSFLEERVRREHDTKAKVPRSGTGSKPLGASVGRFESQRVLRLREVEPVDILCRGDRELLRCFHHCIPPIPGAMGKIDKVGSW